MVSRSLYLIALTKASEQAWAALRKEWPEQHCIANDRLAFVTLGSLTTATHIKETLGFGVEPNDPVGLVSQVHSGEYTGVLPRETVSWLRKVEDDAAQG